MTTHDWLPLMEYSAKYRVSLSTLRRRIKSGELEYKLADGKYLLRDGELQAVNLRPPETIAPPTSVKSQKPGQVQAAVAPPEKITSAGPTAAPVDNDQFWRATQGLLNEIKKAYSLILQEKEEQILQLKEEVADLKTLVRVLEDDNTRLKSTQPAPMDFDLGLEV